MNKEVKKIKFRKSPIASLITGILALIAFGVSIYYFIEQYRDFQAYFRYGLFLYYTESVIILLVSSAICIILGSLSIAYGSFDVIRINRGFYYKKDKVVPTSEKGEIMDDIMIIISIPVVIIAVLMFLSPFAMRFILWLFRSIPGW